MILRLKVFDLILTRNVAKFGKMSPYIEASWNDDTWRSQIHSSGISPISINEAHIFEGPELSPLTIKVLHSSLLFSYQEIGTSIISSEDLSLNKSKEWIELYFEGNSAGKVQVSTCMYEERRSEQSTHTTSYATVNLNEEYARKLNELELEKEELEFYKRKYKRKLEKLNQEKRVYKSKVKEIVKKATPRHTEEASSDEVLQVDEDCWKMEDGTSAWPGKSHKKRLMSVRSVACSNCDLLRSLDVRKVADLRGSKSTSDAKVGIDGKGLKGLQGLEDWLEVDEGENGFAGLGELELRLDMSRPCGLAGGGGRAKGCEDCLNDQVKGNQCMTGKSISYY